MTAEFLNSLLSLINQTTEEFDSEALLNNTPVYLNTEENLKILKKNHDYYWGECCADYYDSSHEFVYYSFQEGLMSFTVEDAIDWIKEVVQNGRQ